METCSSIVGDSMDPETMDGVKEDTEAGGEEELGKVFLSSDSEHLETLSRDLASEDPEVKLKSITTLTYLCQQRSAEDLRNVTSILDAVKVLKRLSSRYEAVVDELAATDVTLVVYQSAILKFLRSIVTMTTNSEERTAIATELVQHGILEVFDFIRNADLCNRDLKQEVQILEIEIFAVGNQGFEYDRHLVEIVQAILSRVSNTPRQAIFVSFLRRLLCIDSNGVLADHIWNVLERLVRRPSPPQKTAVDPQTSPPPRPESSADRVTVLGAARAPEDMPEMTTQVNLATQDSYKVHSCGSDPTLSSMLGESSSTCIPPPVPPPFPACGLPPPPPPPLGGLRSPHRPESAPPSSRLTPRGPDGSSMVEFPQQRTPFPKMQMKRLQWNKIPISRVASSPGNLWIEVAEMFKDYQLNYERMEKLFANAGNGTTSCSSVNGSAGTKGRELSVSEGSFCERKTKKIDQINLIDSKRSMNVNIFLRQFRMTNVDIVNCLRSGDSQKMGPERLRSLLKILPEPEDIQLLSAFEGDRTQLGSAEKFYLELIALPNHKFMAEALLMKEEFSQTIDYVKPAIDAIILSARDIKDSKALHEILYTVLMAGNFLNSGVYSGNAAGFQLQSLLKLSELRANTPRMTLLHFVAQEIETKNPHLIDKLKKLKYLAEASHYSIEALLNDISTLQNRVRTISSQISIADLRFQQQMKDFLEMAHSEMDVLELDVRELEELRVELAGYFCEDAQSFKLDDCVSTFNSFCKMFHKALEENRERHLQDLRAEQRRRLREEQMADKRRSLTSDDSQSRRSPEGHAMESSKVSARFTDAVDCSRERNGGHERRIQISQTMPSFLIESTQDSSREASPCPGVTAPINRHKKRNSMSNFRKMLPQTPGESIDAERENELIDVLLKSASAAEESDRRPGSSSGSVRQRRRSRASIDIIDRERAPSPSPLNASVPNMETGSPRDNTANGGNDELDRGQPARSSCPSRISSAQGRKQLLKDALLHQHAANDATTSDGQNEESGSCPSDAEVSAKQERENRRMERRMRSNIDSSISNCDVKSVIGDTSNTKPASCIPGLPLKTVSDLNPLKTNSAQDDQLLGLPDKQASETQVIEVKTQIGKPSNLTNGTSLSSADLFYEDVQSRTTVARRDAANIRSLGDQRRWSSELEKLGTTTEGLPPSNTIEIGPDPVKFFIAGSMAKDASEHNIDQTALGEPSPEQDTLVLTAPPQKARLNSLVKQHNIPQQRISAGMKLNSGSHKNITNAEGTQMNENDSKKLRSQSDHRLVRDSDENLTYSTHPFKEKSEENVDEEQRLKEIAETDLNCATTTKRNQSYHSEASVSSAQGVYSQGFNADGDQQKRWGRVFEEKEAPNSAARETRQTQAIDNERVSEDKEKDEDRTKERLLQSATVRDYGELHSSLTAGERASFRKEKLRKLSQLYSAEDDDDLLKTHVSTSNHFMEDPVPHATASATDQFSNRTSSRESTDPKLDTESFYSVRDEGFDSEGHSLCSASQRTSMSSTAESDIRITPMMTRKTYTNSGEKEVGDEPDDSETSALLGRASIDSVVGKRIQKAAASPKQIDNTHKTSSTLNRSLTKTSSKATLSSSNDIHTTDKSGVRKGLSKAIDSQRPKALTHIAAATNKILPKNVPSPRNVPSSTAVQYRIAKPNMVSVSRAPTPKSDSRAVKTNPDKTPSGSPAATSNRSSSAMGKSPSKVETKLKTAEAIKRQPTENKVTSSAAHATNSSTAGEKGRTTQEKSIPSQATFVRGVGVRATVPADVLRENKKTAIESRQVRNIATPAPPRRTTSLLDANNTSVAKKTSVSVLNPRKPSANAAGLPAVELPATHIETTPTANEAKLAGTRKTSSELKMPLGRADRSKVSTKIPDPAARRLSTDPHIGDSKFHSSVSTASVGLSRQRQDCPPVTSVQTKVIHVATRSKPSSAVNDRSKPRTLAAKTVSVSSLA